MPPVGRTITPEQMLAQWARAAHQLQVNAHNFVVKGTKEAVGVFKGSFDKERFNSNDGKPWERTPYYHGLDDLGVLKNSIRVKYVQSTASKHRGVIHTDPSEFVHSSRHPGFVYAGVHNNLNSIASKPKWGPKHERQFIGHSSVLEDKLSELVTSTLMYNMPL